MLMVKNWKIISGLAALVGSSLLLTACPMSSNQIYEPDMKQGNYTQTVPVGGYGGQGQGGRGGEGGHGGR